MKKIMKKEIVIKEGKKYEVVPWNAKWEGKDGELVEFLVPLDESVRKIKAEAPCSQMNCIIALTPEESKAWHRKVAIKARLLAKNEIQLVNLVNEYLNNRYKDAGKNELMIRDCLIKKFRLLSYRPPDKAAYFYYRALMEHKKTNSSNSSEEFFKEHFKILGGCL
jgi:hypothetical protein